MRALKFTKPRKITRRFLRFYSYEYAKGNNYEKISMVITNKGIARVSELDWEHNFGRSTFSLFEAKHGGLLYSAWLEEARLSERQLKWLTTYFINRIIDGKWINLT